MSEFQVLYISLLILSLISIVTYKIYKNEKLNNTNHNPNKDILVFNVDVKAMNEKELIKVIEDNKDQKLIVKAKERLYSINRRLKDKYS